MTVLIPWSNTDKCAEILCNTAVIRPRHSLRNTRGYRVTATFSVSHQSCQRGRRRHRWFRFRLAVVPVSEMVFDRSVFGAFEFRPSIKGRTLFRSYIHAWKFVDSMVSTCLYIAWIIVNYELREQKKIHCTIVIVPYRWLRFRELTRIGNSPKNCSKIKKV